MTAWLPNGSMQKGSPGWFRSGASVGSQDGSASNAAAPLGELRLQHPLWAAALECQDPLRSAPRRATVVGACLSPPVRKAGSDSARSVQTRCTPAPGRRRQQEPKPQPRTHSPPRLAHDTGSAAKPVTCTPNPGMAPAGGRGVHHSAGVKRRAGLCPQGCGWSSNRSSSQTRKKLTPLGALI